MTDQDIKSTIRELQETLEKSGQVGPDTRHLLQELDEDLHRLLQHGKDTDESENGLQERLEALAADFDSRHPQLSAMLRELGVALARVGI